jgi:hypothetical protein
MNGTKVVMPECPAGGATGEGCVRKSLNFTHTFEEECGPGYNCVH